MSDRKTIKRGTASQRDHTTIPSSARRHRSFPIVGVGASAGGLEAFTQLLKHLPLNTGLGFVLVQHLDPQHESALTQLLARATRMPVREVANNLPVEPNHIYIIPPNTSLTITGGVLKLQPRARASGAHRTIDSFLESLAQDQRERAIGVILSGTATDGTLGLEAIKAEGGITFAQDDSARYDSMPRSAVAAGCVDFVLSPEHIAKELARIAKHPYVAGRSPAIISPAEERAEATAHEDDETPLPSGGHGTPPTRAGAVRREADRRGKVAETSLSRLRGERGPEDGFKRILLLLRNHSGVDFSLYKSTTIQRRVTRRMVLNKQTAFEGYAKFLRANAKELDALYSDVLIGVTSFFRNPEAFDVLKHKIFPRLLQHRGDDPVRVWVLGCSTGQEAYSIAMAFSEAAESVSRARNLQVFATDLNDALLDKARQGLYAKTLVEDISPERLRRFFVEEQGGYRIIKPLREKIVFARQNLITDPPFSRMDLISCRNVLIYLEPGLQKKALPTFHYALKPEGFLLLGASESIGSFTDLFEPAHRKHRIYSRKPALTHPLHLPIKKSQAGRVAPRAPGGSPPMTLPHLEPASLRTELYAQREADRLTVNQFAPPGVLVNAELQILQFRGATSAYLEPATGKATFDVLKMAREGLMLPLRSALKKARKENTIVRKNNIRFQQNGKIRTVNVQVIPLRNLRERCFLILFEDAEESYRREQRKDNSSSSPFPPLTPAKGSSRRTAQLQRELFETRDYLQSIQERHESATEELQASNEEVQSANEELQSVNEELETSKEELESTNEELTTVNEEMAHRNSELSRLNSDLVNLQSSTRLAIVSLGRDLTIRSFSPQAEKQFHLLATDIGRPFSTIRHNLVFAKEDPLPSDGRGGSVFRRGRRRRAVASSAAVGVSPSPGGEGGLSSPAAGDLETLLSEVIATVHEREQEVQDTDGRWYSLRVRPYLTLDNRVDGAVLVLVDIDDLKRTEERLKEARDYAEATIRTARDPLVILRADLKVDKANDAFYKTFKVTPPETENVLIYELGSGQWDIPELRRLLEEILPRSSVFNDLEVTHDFAHIGRRTMLLNARRLDSHSGAPEKILLGIEDVTEWQRAWEVRDKLASIVESSDDAIVSKDLNGIITSWNKGAERLFGYSAPEAIGQSVMILVPPERFDEEPSIMALIRQGQSIDHYETIRRRKDDSLVDISLTVSPIRNSEGQVVGASKIARDITAQKKAEQALRESQALLADHAVHLEQLVAERTARLQETVAELEHFSYSITHDMRSPLRAMQGFSEMLLSESGNDLTPSSTDHLKRIMRAAERMDALIRDSLQYAKIIRERTPLASVDPGRVLRGILESYPNLQPPHMEIEVAEPLPPVIANETGLTQCFSNLLANAIKFVRPDTVPHVRIWAEKRGDFVRFWFEDNGIGISKEYQERILDMFQQLDRSYTGTGIGLALVRKTADRMDGRVGVESEPGGGSRFWLEFRQANLPTE